MKKLLVVLIVTIMMASTATAMADLQFFGPEAQNLEESMTTVGYLDQVSLVAKYQRLGLLEDIALYKSEISRLMSLAETLPEDRAAAAYAAVCSLYNAAAIASWQFIDQEFLETEIPSLTAHIDELSYQLIGGEGDVQEVIELLQVRDQLYQYMMKLEGVEVPAVNGYPLPLWEF